MAVNPILSIRLLGGFQIANGQEPATNLERARLHELLAYLLLQRGRPIPCQHLAFLFWPDSSEKQARTNLRSLWYWLRQALPQADRCLATDDLTMQWLADAPCRLDVAVFENHLAQVQTAVDDNERLHYLEQVDLSRQGTYCLTPYLFMPTCTRMSVYLLGGFQVCYGETALSERFIPHLSRIAHLLVHGHGRLLTLFLTLYGLAVLRYISGTIVSFFISGQATGNQRAGNAAWPVAE